MNDGQHRSYSTGAPGQNTGQRSKITPGAFVGNKSGPEENMKVRPTRCDADINTTSHSGGDGPNLIHSGKDRADDKR